MEALSINTCQYAAHTLALKLAAGIAAALLAALLLGSLLSMNWTLPMDPAVAASFTA